MLCAWLAVVVQIIAVLLIRGSCWQDWCFCLDMFYGYRFRIWIYVLPWDMYVFQRMLVSPSVSWVHFTEISERCRAASTVGLSLWLEAFRSLHKENAPICLACQSFISSCEGQSSRIFFMQKCPFALCLAQTKLPLQSLLFLRQWALLLCAWGCSFYTLLFLPIKEGENEKRIFCLLGLRNPVDSTLREGKRAEVYV